MYHLGLPDGEVQQAAKPSKTYSCWKEQVSLLSLSFPLTCRWPHGSETPLYQLWHPAGPLLRKWNFFPGLVTWNNSQKYLMKAHAKQALEEQNLPSSAEINC